MKFKNVALLMIIAGLGYAVYTGQLSDLLDGLSKSMAATGNAASAVTE